MEFHVQLSKRDELVGWSSVGSVRRLFALRQVEGNSLGGTAGRSGGGAGRMLRS